jgi:hypothetical protein
MRAAVLLLALAAAPAGGTGPTTFVGGVRVQDEIVVVNTRGLCGVTDVDRFPAGLRFETYAVRDDVGFRHWQPSNLESFLDFDPTVRTIFFVHGNQIPSYMAKTDGLQVYSRLLHHDPNSERLRFVIVSWPSDKVGGLLRDVREKAARTGPVGVQFGWLLDQMPAETPIALLGFSFGSRIVTGGLHVAAGGRLGSAGLVERAHPNRAPMNVVLMGSALNAEWLGEGRYHGLALTQVDRMLLLNSCQDPAMQYYHLLTPGLGGPQALGLRGPTCLSAEQAAKIRQRDVGTPHQLFAYLCAPGAAAQAWEYLSGGVNVTAAAN